MAAITRSSPPQLGRRLKSTANTRLSRAIQLSAVLPALDAHSSLALALIAASGRGTSAANRAMKSCGCGRFEGSCRLKIKITPPYLS
jgi:hypothetical protein